MLPRFPASISMWNLAAAASGHFVCVPAYQFVSPLSSSPPPPAPLPRPVRQPLHARAPPRRNRLDEALALLQRITRSRSSEGGASGSDGGGSIGGYRMLIKVCMMSNMHYVS